MATPKQKKLLRLFVENLGTANSTKTLGQLLLEAGYSDIQSKNPHQIFASETIKEGLTDVAEKLASERDRILKELNTKDLTEEKYKDLVDSLDKLNKNYQLSTGGATERQVLQVKFDNAFETPSSTEDSSQG